MNEGLHAHLESQVSKPAVSRVSQRVNPATVWGLPTGKSAIQQVRKPALRRAGSTKRTRGMEAPYVGCYEIEQRWRISRFHLLEGMEDGFGFGNESGELLTALDWRVAGEVAGLEKFAERSEGGFGNAAWNEIFLDDSFGDRRGREVEAFAELFPEEMRERGEELVGVVGSGVAAQIGEALADDVRDMNLAAQLRIIGEVINAATQDEERSPSEQRDALRGQEPGPCDERSGGLSERTELTFDFDDVLSRRGIFLRGFGWHRDGGRRGGSAGPDH